MPTLIKMAAFVLAGPVLAFAILFLGCDSPAQAFGNLCGHNIMGSMVWFTLAAWFIIATVNSLFQALRPQA
jgi:hypothetical protein